MTTREQIIKAAQSYWRRDQWNNEYFDAAGFADFVFEAGRVAEREETNRRPLPDNTAPYIRARSTK